MSWEPPSQALARAEAAALGLCEPVAPGLFLSERPYIAGAAGYGVGGGELLDVGEPGSLRLPKTAPIHVARGPWKVSRRRSGAPGRRIHRPRSGPRTSALYLYCAEHRWYLVRATPSPAFVAPSVPHRNSASLPSRMARAIINLLTRPGEHVLDPCCGAGVLLIEALRRGCTAHASDLSGRAIEQARANLRALGLQAQLETRDAFTLTGARRCDALVTDLPYGKLLERPDIDAWIALLPQLARRWAVVASVDLRTLSPGPGANGIHTVIQVPKSTLVRYICLGGEAR